MRVIEHFDELLNETVRKAAPRRTVDAPPGRLRKSMQVTDPVCNMAIESEQAAAREV